MRRVLGLTFGVTLTAAALGGCGSSSKASDTVGGPCFTNGTCNAGLECLSDLCVQPAGAGGSGGGRAPRERPVKQAPRAGAAK